MFFLNFILFFVLSKRENGSKEETVEVVLLASRVEVGHERRFSTGSEGAAGAVLADRWFGGEGGCWWVMMVE